MNLGNVEEQKWHGGCYGLCVDVPTKLHAHMVELWGGDGLCTHRWVKLMNLEQNVLLGGGVQLKEAITEIVAWKTRSPPFSCCFLASMMGAAVLHQAALLSCYSYHYPCSCQ